MRKMMLVGLSVLLFGSWTWSFAGQNNQDLPRVVRSISLTGQTQQIPETKLFTPEKDGLFRISVYLVPTATDGQNFVGFDVLYTDETGPEYLSFFTQAFQVGCSTQQSPYACYWTTVVRAKGELPISYQVSVCEGCKVTYDMFATVEKLQ
jgi:hypothetical protein